jgi:hypothetical protein
MSDGKPDISKGMTDGELIELYRIRSQIALRDPYYWLKYFTFTKDEHDPTYKAKPLPDRAYIRLVARAWEEFNILFIEKSRQIMMTWLMVALDLWDAMSKYSRNNLYQSKDQDDANDCISRARDIYDNAVEITYPIIGQWLPQAKKIGNKTGTADKIEFPSMKSQLVAIPGTGDAVRHNTSSTIFGDEMNHQQQFREAYEAGMPTITGGGRCHNVGTPNGFSYAYHVMYGLDPDTGESLGERQIDSDTVKERLFEIPKGLSSEEERFYIEKKLLELPDEKFKSIPFEILAANMPGVRYWRTPPSYNLPDMPGIDVLSLHYTCDPYKDPKTKQGTHFVKMARRLYPARSSWRREMDIKYDSFVGRPVILNWDETVFVRKLEYDERYPIETSHDFGTQINCSLFSQTIPLTINGKVYKQLRFLREIKLTNSDTPEQAQKAEQLMRREYPSAWAAKRVKSCCDPLGDRQNETTADKSMNTSIKIFKAHGFSLNNRKFGVQESTELIETVFSLFYPNGEPAILIDESCTYLRSCCAALHYAEKGKGKEGHYVKEGYYEHGGDTMRYRIANTFTEYDLTWAEKPEYGRREYIYGQTGKRLASKPNKKSIISQSRGGHVVHSV